jgi:hypothetical protein
MSKWKQELGKGSRGAGLIGIIGTGKGERADRRKGAGPGGAIFAAF